MYQHTDSVSVHTILMHSDRESMVYTQEKCISSIFLFDQYTDSVSVHTKVYQHTDTLSHT